MAKHRYTGPMQVSEDAPRPWLQGLYPANSYARNQDPSTGVISQKPDGVPDGSSPLFCAVVEGGWYCSVNRADALQGVNGQLYTEQPQGSVIVSRRSDAEA